MSSGESVVAIESRVWVIFGGLVVEEVAVDVVDGVHEFGSS